ncbi:MAG: ABC transporter permease [Lachnospiraceae bacterium]|nr:ABC transporter permease [Lachnospiraceae bacterium]
MNIFKTYVLRNLKNNKVRTIMTIAGIMLSVALITAVIEGGFSGLEYLRNIIKETYGDHHGYAYNMDEVTEDEFMCDEELEGHAEFETVGWTDIGSANSTKPYMVVKAASENIADFLAVDIISGHFPENDDEILIPEHLASNGNVRYQIGDTITVTYGIRVVDGKSVPDNTKLTVDEELVYTGSEYTGETRTYTVCGIMNRLSYHVEDYMCPGYTAIVLLDEKTHINSTYNGLPIANRSVLFRVKDPAKYNSFASGYIDSHKGISINKNSELVALYGGSGSENITLFLSGFIAILIGLILFGSISLVYNSFSISINERTKQIGILKSVGATKKQIRKTVFYEAFFESITSVPLGLVIGCIGMSATFWLLDNAFALFINTMLGYGSGDVKIKVVINIPLLAIGVLIVLITTILSAAIPAYRASRVSPIDLVRQASDIKMKKKVVGAKLFTKLFGAEGMLAAKNYSRNRKRYRATVVSLSVSIILFITASSFCAYLTKATDMEFYMGNMSMVLYETGGYLNEEEMAERETDKYIQGMKEMLNSAENVNNTIAVKNLYSYEIINPEAADTAIWNEYGDDEKYYEELYSNCAEVIFIDDESFNKLLEEENITVPASVEKPAVMYNTGSYYIYDGNDNRVKVEYSFIKDEKLPKTYTIRSDSVYTSPDKACVGQVLDENGEIYVVFIDDEYLEDYYTDIYTEEQYMGLEALQKEMLLEYLKNGGAEGIKDADAGAENGNTHITLPEVVIHPDAEEMSEYNYEYVDYESGEICNVNISQKTLDALQHVTFEKYEELTHYTDVQVVGITENKDYVFSDSACMILPFSAIGEGFADSISTTDYYMYSDDSAAAESEVNKLLIENGKDTSGLYNYDKTVQGRRMISRIVSVFAYGFILLISLVSIANVFNTISTNVAHRRREFAIFKSMGLSNKGITKILNIECLIYGLKSIVFGLPLSIPVTYVMYMFTRNAFSVPFSIPWYSVLIASVSVFIVVFVTMLYASGKIKKDNTIDALRNENV